MAGSGPSGAEHWVACEIRINVPVIVEVLGYNPAGFARILVDNALCDPHRHVKAALIAPSLIGRHKRFCAMHVGVLAAVVAELLPVGSVFFGHRASFIVPKTGEDHGHDLFVQGFCFGMLNETRAGGRQKDKGMAIGLLVATFGCDVIQAPKEPAIDGVSVAFQKIIRNVPFAPAWIGEPFPSS